MNELVLPFIGSVGLGPLVIGAVALLLTWEHIPAIIGFVFQAIVSLASKTKTAVVAPTPEQKIEITAIETSVDSSLDSLQNLTRWAVHDAAPEVLTKITGLYSDIQKQIKDKA